MDNKLERVTEQEWNNHKSECIQCTQAWHKAGLAQDSAEKFGKALNQLCSFGKKFVAQAWAKMDDLN